MCFSRTTSDFPVILDGKFSSVSIMTNYYLNTWKRFILGEGRGPYLENVAVRLSDPHG
jgi:hypothetical protein